MTEKTALELLIERIPAKEEFYPPEVARIMKIGVREAYRKIEKGDLDAEFRSERQTIITRVALIKYLIRTEEKRLFR